MVQTVYGMKPATDKVNSWLYRQNNFFLWRFCSIIFGLGVFLVITGACLGSGRIFYTDLVLTIHFFFLFLLCEKEQSAGKKTCHMTQHQKTEDIWSLHSFRLQNTEKLSTILSPLLLGR